MGKKNMLVFVIALVALLIEKKGLLYVLSSAAGGSTVKHLPGFEGPLPFNLETGYVGVDEGESANVQLFYYFVKSERNPKKDPLLFWIAGGPGCSSWSSLVYEVGPLTYRYEPYNGSGTLPTLVYNEHSWTKVSNMVFIDSPVGAGFSYSKNSSTFRLDDLLQARHLVQFTKKWLIEHPEFISNSVYIAGSSYSGIPLPIFVQALSNEIEKGMLPSLNLEGYVLGNPCTNKLSDADYRIPFAHGQALISDELYEALKRSCQGKYYHTSNIECLKYMQVFEECISGIALENILESQCVYSDEDIINTRRPRRRGLNQDSDPFLPLIEFDCMENQHLLSRYWANDPRVQNALHVRKGMISEWKRCHRNLPYDKLNVPTSFLYHVKLSAKGYRSLIFSGDHDLMIPTLGTQAWIRSLNYSIVDDWRSWIIQGQVAGYTRTYSNRMTFATIKGGGHTCQHTPKQCGAMFQRWIDDKSL